MNNLIKKRYLSIFIAFCLVIGMIKPISADKSHVIISQEPKNKREEKLKKLQNIIDYAKQNYYKDVDEDAIFESIYKSALNSLDDYSYYMDPDTAKQFMEEIDGKFYGAGFVLSIHNGKLEIIRVLEDSPAFHAKLEKGDVLLEVDGKDIKPFGMDEVVDMIRGEKGTVVKLKVQKQKDASIVDVELKRAEIKSKSVEFSINDGVGILQIHDFSNLTLEYTDEILKQNSHLDKFIIDLRSNPGGLLEVAVNLADKFLPEGKVITTAKYKNFDDKEYKSSKEYVDAKLIVLIDEYSASASEVFAGALKDNKRALIMGNKSFGKGTIQTISYVDFDKSVVKITIGEYLLPNGESINKIGITPDIIVEKPKSTKQDLYPMNSLKESKRGSFDIDTYGMQQRLNLLGYELGVDGKFGANTEHALKDWQRKNGLKSTGVLDAKSKLKLSEMVERLSLSSDDIVLERAIKEIKKL